MMAWYPNLDENFQCSALIDRGWITCAGDCSMRKESGDGKVCPDRPGTQGEAIKPREVSDGSGCGSFREAQESATGAAAVAFERHRSLRRERLL